MVSSSFTRATSRSVSPKVRLTLAATGTAGTDRLRGTSFAAPLVAGRLALRYPAPSVDRIGPAVTGLVMEARDLGHKGRDKVYGHGLICGACGGR